MAIYTDLYALPGSAETLRQKIVVAIAVKANAIAKLASPTVGQRQWAKDALTAPAEYLPAVMNYIIADYNTAATTSIVNATDAQVQAAVNSAVDTLFGV